jgi:hypothetical protein
MAQQLFNAITDGHFECLDLFPVTWTTTGVEEQRFDGGILFEIWKTGGMLQASVPIPEGTVVDLTPAGRAISATITHCEEETSGYLIRFSINDGQYDQWFPQSYCPPSLHCEEKERFADYDSTIW